MNKWETLSHTHRGFDRSRPVPASVEAELTNIAQSFCSGKEYTALFIKNAPVIDFIYDQSSLPVVDSVTLNTTLRKNSQLLAPLLFCLTSKRNQTLEYNNNYNSGKVYAQLALSAINRDLQTGFCICYDLGVVENYLFKQGILNPEYKIDLMPFLAFGYQTANKPYNWAPDINKTVSSIAKISQSRYIREI